MPSFLGLFRRSRASAPVVPVETFGFVELRGGGSRVVIVPSLGGKITALELGGRQWLWSDDAPSPVVPDESTPYADVDEMGGLDECFPTIASCRVPTWIRGFGGATLPDHGELWAQAPAIDVRTSPDGQRAITTWMGRRMPYRFVREIRVSPSGEVIGDYTVTNTGVDRVPFIWAAQPVLPLTPSTRIELPNATRFHVYAQHDITLGAGATDLRWPMARAAGHLIDMSRPFDVAKRYACKLFLDMREGRAAVVESDVRLEMSFDVDAVPNFGLWIDRGWSTPRHGRRPSTIVFAPGIGAPDSLEDALGAWKSAHWLESGGSRQWSIRWRAVAEAPAAGDQKLT